MLINKAILKTFAFVDKIKLASEYSSKTGQEHKTHSGNT